MSTVERDWLEDVFFHDSTETLKRKHAKMIEALRKNPITAHAEEAIRWMEVCAEAQWPAETDDLRVLLRVNLLSRLREQRQIIPFSPRMIGELEYISHAFECFYAGQVFAPIRAEIVSWHHLHHILAIRVWHSTSIPAPINIKLFAEEAPLVNDQTPRQMVDRLYDLYKRVEKERVRLSRLIQPDFYEDLQSEWTRVKRKQPGPGPVIEEEEEEEEEEEKSEEKEEEEEEDKEAKKKFKESRDYQSDDSDNVFGDAPVTKFEEEEEGRVREKEEDPVCKATKPLLRFKPQKTVDPPRQRLIIKEEEDE